MFKKLLRSKRGAALLEYSLLAAGVSLIAAAGVSVFGHKTNDLISSVAAIMPGAHADDNGPISSGKIIETTVGANGGIVVDAVTANRATSRLEENLGITGLDDGLIVEVEITTP